MLPELALRSPEADWDRARWETLPDDGNRYEVIDGVLYLTTAPSSFHQWIIRPQIPIRTLGIKRGAYARAGVPEYWIVRPASRDALVCSQPDAALGDYAQVQHVAADAELISPTLPIRAPLAGFFAGAPDTTL
jgi:Uma2 family endonuclease